MITLIIYKDRTTNIPLSQYEIKYKMLLLLSSVSALIGWIITIVGRVSRIVSSKVLLGFTINFVDEIPFLIFVVFGFFTSIYGIVRGTLKKPLGFIYSIFAILAILSVGHLFFESGFVVSSCSYTTPYYLASCSDILTIFFGALIFIISVAITLISKKNLG